AGDLHLDGVGAGLCKGVSARDVEAALADALHGASGGLAVAPVNDGRVFRGGSLEITIGKGGDEALEGRASAGGHCEAGGVDGGGAGGKLVLVRSASAWRRIDNGNAARLTPFGRREQSGQLVAADKVRDQGRTVPVHDGAGQEARSAQREC